MENNDAPFSIRIDAQITGEGPTLSALDANAAAFHAFGGSPLMLTEHVENGIDAIKVQTDWKETDTKTNIGKIQIILDDVNSKLIIIDDGSGIEDPLWVLRHPLHSRKSGMKYQVGKYGRGLQGFRGFCTNFEYISLREEAHESEKQDYEERVKSGLAPLNVDLRCIHLKLTDRSVTGTYTPIPITEFHKYTNNKSGTVAIFSDWHEGEFEDIKRKKVELIRRLEHHFRDVLENELIDITITINNKSQEIEARDFSIMDKFDMEDIQVYDPVWKQVVGTIKFFLYKSSGEYKHDFKKPFLLAKDNRPLQNSFLSDMPKLSEDTVWRSPFVTGYIKCDFIEPNQLRIALSIEGNLRERNELFYEHIRNAARRLRTLVAEYQGAFLNRERTSENQNIILELQTFLKKQKVKLNLPDLNRLGGLQNGRSNNLSKGDRISSQPGTRNQGRVTPKGTDQVVILYKPKKVKAGKGTDGNKKIEKIPVKRIAVKVRDPKNDGRAQKTVMLDPNLLSQDGRRVKRPQVGIDLDMIEEESNEDMSYYDENTQTIYVNIEHNIFQKMEKMKRDSAERDQAYSKKQKNFIRRCYFWEMIKNFHNPEDGKDKFDKFWELYHTFFLYKDVA